MLLYLEKCLVWRLQTLTRGFTPPPVVMQNFGSLMPGFWDGLKLGQQITLKLLLRRAADLEAREKAEAAATRRIYVVVRARPFHKDTVFVTPCASWLLFLHTLTDAVLLCHRGRQPDFVAALSVRAAPVGLGAVVQGLGAAAEAVLQALTAQRIEAAADMADWRLEAREEHACCEHRNLAFCGHPTERLLLRYRRPSSLLRR